MLATAVLRTGEHALAFRAASGDRFVPVEVKISPMKFEQHYHVVEGLRAGDRVVTSANFLIDSESRLRAGGAMSMPGMDMGDMPGMDHPGAKKNKRGMDHSKMKH